jgi:hypothetical protein
MLTRILSNLRRQWLGASLGMLALFVAIGGATVFAQGGDPNRVRACVFDSSPPSEPNVRIIGENESCPARSTPRDWAIQGPQGPQGAEGPAGPAALSPLQSPDPPSFAALAEDFNFSISKYKIVKKSSPLSTASGKGATTGPCPATHKKLHAGGYETTGVPANAINFLPLISMALPGPRWHATAVWATPTAPWRITAYIVCKK